MPVAFAWRILTRKRKRGLFNTRWILTPMPLALLIAMFFVPQTGQCTALVDAKGSKASCLGIGPIVNKCVKLAEDAGLIKENDVGTTGLTFGISGKDDGHITEVVPTSAGAQAGLQVGDLIVAINGKPTKPTPGMVATERTFGARGDGVQIKVRRGGKELEFNLVRDPQNAPVGPQSGTILISVKPMINWKGQFIPCMGAGPAGFAAIDYCYKIFTKDGYVKVGDLGSTGLQLDLDRSDAAVVASVNPDSAAAKAGLRPGDEIVQVNETPLGESVGGLLPELLFGRAGTALL
jgi:membrane-associated protease RseP (regulator of RpoE activity)